MVASPLALKIQPRSFRTQTRKHVPVTISLGNQFQQLEARLSLTTLKFLMFQCLQVKAQVVALKMRMEQQLEEYFPSTNSSYSSNKFWATLVLILKP